MVAVTKGFGLDAVHAALEAGLDGPWRELRRGVGGQGDRGWTRTPCGISSAPCSGTRCRTWRHSSVCGRAWHGEPEGARIARFAPGASVLVQVDTTGLPGRNGCAPSEVAELVQRLRDLGLAVRGLMTVAAPGPAGGGGVRRSRTAGRRVGPRGALHGNERRPRGGRGSREHDGARRAGLFGERPSGRAA